MFRAVGCANNSTQSTLLNTIFAFLTAQNSHLNAQENLWCVQMTVLRGFTYIVYIQWIIKVDSARDNKCEREKAPFRAKRTPSIMQKDYIYHAKGLLLHSDCASFAMQKGLLCTPEVVLRE